MVENGFGQGFLSHFEDHVRQSFTTIRGFEMFWLEKNGIKTEQWQELRLIDVMRIRGMGNRKFRRKKYGDDYN